MEWLNNPKSYKSRSCSSFNPTCDDYCSSYNPDNGCGIRACSRGICDSNACIIYFD